MKRIVLLVGILALIVCFAFKNTENEQHWIRINQLGYTPNGSKVAVWCSKESFLPEKIELVNAETNQAVYVIEQLEAFGAYGPFNKTARVRFTSFRQPGRYFLRAGNTVSPTFVGAYNVNRNLRFLYKHPDQF